MGVRGKDADTVKAGRSPIPPNLIDISERCREANMVEPRRDGGGDCKRTGAGERARTGDLPKSARGGGGERWTAFFVDGGGERFLLVGGGGERCIARLIGGGGDRCTARLAGGGDLNRFGEWAGGERCFSVLLRRPRGAPSIRSMRPCIMK